jgi:hypothetical protein
MNEEKQRPHVRTYTHYGVWLLPPGNGAYSEFYTTTTQNEEKKVHDHSVSREENEDPPPIRSSLPFLVIISKRWSVAANIRSIDTKFLCIFIIYYVLHLACL